MDQTEDGEEGVPLSKASLRGGHESWIKAQKWDDHHCQSSTLRPLHHHLSCFIYICFIPVQNRSTNIILLNLNPEGCPPVPPQHVCLGAALSGKFTFSFCSCNQSTVYSNRFLSFFFLSIRLQYSKEKKSMTWRKLQHSNFLVECMPVCSQTRREFFHWCLVAVFFKLAYSTITS